MTAKICPTCTTRFDCGSQSGTACWCLALPPVMPMAEANVCYCPDCLKNTLKACIDAFCTAVTPEMALSCGATRYASKGPLLEDIDYYMDDGKFVLTAWYLLKRGHCCQNGCRHCPYGFRKPD